MRQYADYKYYKEAYGGLMPEQSFDKLSIQNSAYIDKFTFNRLENINPVPEWLKYACCAMCEISNEYLDAKSDGKNIKSVSNSGYSVTYSDESVSEQGYINKLQTIMQLYIPNEYLTYDISYDLKERGYNFEQ